jgi:hypothetical protein
VAERASYEETRATRAAIKAGFHVSTPVSLFCFSADAGVGSAAGATPSLDGLGAPASTFGGCGGCCGQAARRCPCRDDPVPCWEEEGGGDGGWGGHCRGGI